MKSLRGAGGVFLAINSGRILMNLRTKKRRGESQHEWGIFGGKIEKTENLKEGLLREIEEEIGFIPSIIKFYPLDQSFEISKNKDKEFNYYTFLFLVENEFIPNLNHESLGYCWIDIGKWPKPIHPNVRKTFMSRSFKKNLVWAKKEFSKK